MSISKRPNTSNCKGLHASRESYKVSEVKLRGLVDACNTRSVQSGRLQLSHGMHAAQISSKPRVRQMFGYTS